MTECPVHMAWLARVPPSKWQSTVTMSAEREVPVPPGSLRGRD